MKDEKNISIMPDLTRNIKQSNRLVEANYYLSALEQKVILFLISQLDRNAENFCTMTVKINDLADSIGLGEDRYTVLNKLTDGLLSKVLVIRQEKDKKSWYKTHWVQSMEYHAGKGVLTAQFDEKLRPDLLRLKDAYVSGNTRVCLSFRGKYTARFYMLIKQYEKIGERIFNIVDIIDRFMLGKTYQDRISNLKNYVIEPALAEIKQKSDITFEYEYLKEHRSITSIRVYNIRPIKQAKTAISKPISSNKPKLTEEEHDIFLRITNSKKWNITTDVAYKMIAKYGLERIHRNLIYCDKYKNNKYNLGGFLIKAIVNDYGKNEHSRMVESKQKKMSLQSSSEENKYNNTNDNGMVNSQLSDIEIAIIKERKENIGTFLLNKIKSMGLTVEGILGE